MPKKACAIRNRENSRMLAKNGAIDDQFFRYKCQDAGDGALRLAALSLFFLSKIIKLKKNIFDHAYVLHTNFLI